MELSTDFENVEIGLAETSQDRKSQLNLLVRKTPSTGMSSSLKERLKKCGRYHPANSPHGRLSTPRSQSGQIKSQLSTPQSQCSQIQSQLDCSNSSVSPSFPSTLSNDSTSTTPCSHARSRSRHLPQPRNILTDGSTLFKQEPCSKVAISGDSEKSITSIFSSCENPNKGCGSSQTKKLDHGRSMDAGNDIELSKVPVLGLSSCSSILVSEQHPPASTDGQLADCYVKDLGSETNTVHASSSPVSCEVLLRLKRSLKVQLDQQKESLRKLNMVKTYRTKNNLEQLGTLISKWRSVCQQAVLDLHQMTAEPRPSLSILIQQLGIDAQLLGFNSEEECFDAN